MLNAGFNWFLLAQASKTANDATEPSGVSGWLLFLIILAIFILPFVFGSLLARWLKLKDLSSKMGTILLAMTLGLTPFVWQVASGGKLKDAVSYGIDLAGGTNLLFAVDHKKLDKEKKVTDEAMTQLVRVIAKRINPGGILEVTVRRVGFDRVEVIIPGADLEVVEQIKSRITKLGSLEFGILANIRDHQDIIPAAKKLTQKQKEVRIGGRIVAVWREVGRKANGDPKQIGAADDFVVRQVISSDEDQKLVDEFLVIQEREDKRVTGKYLTNASSGMDQDTGEPIVRFNFNAKGGSLFYRLTGDNLPSADESFHRRLSILLDGRVHSAPNIITRIGRQGQISGGFTRDEVDELVSVLKAGALEVPLKRQPISEMTVSPTMGQDVRIKGINAILIAGSVVLVFMVVYYLFAGMVADMCLALNLILVLGVMALIHATFTLPGLAGLVLTIGMAVDANVLIFERIREESHRGSSLRMAIQNGFSKAFTTIVDANVTTLIVAVVLYLIGTDQVRGFAVTLFIGIVMSMFTSLYFGRLIFDVWERKRWLKTLKMRSVIGTTHWDFVSKKAIAGTISVLLIIVGIGGVISRGEDLLDIDFTGGTMVTFEFKKSQQTEEVRDLLLRDASTFGTTATGKKPTNILVDGFSLETLKLASEEGSDEEGQRFRVRCKNQDANAVKKEIANRCAAAEKNKFALRQVQIVKFDDAMIAKLGKGTAENDVPGGYNEGHKTELQFTDDGLALATFRDYVVRRLEALQVAGQEGGAKYSAPDELLHVEGKTKSSAEATAGERQKYQSILLFTKKEIDRADLIQALKDVETELAGSPIFPEVNNFHSAVASDMQLSAVLAMVFSLLA
ncbi:MAG: protein translocase subunit SecD, partial [Planctomycetes bacterium]|nr:protein translocase subunit SecD [Planctomycetota bacterium]